MRNRVSMVAVFAVSLAVACGYDPHSMNVGPGDGGGGSAGIDVARIEADASEVPGSTQASDAGLGGGEVRAVDGQVTLDAFNDVALDKPTDVPNVGLDGGPDASAGGNTGAGGATGVGGAGGTPEPDAPIANGGAGGSNSTGGATSTGVLGVGGATGVSAGGSNGSGGRLSAGGVASAAGSGGGGNVGTGGTSSVCQSGATQCSNGSLQTCTNGQWGIPTACAVRQTCIESSGPAKCTCNTDPVCSSVGSSCDGTTILASCSQDANGCFYKGSSQPCTAGACGGAPGSSACCTNKCTNGATQCAGDGLQTCGVQSNNCYDWGVAAPCSNGACYGPIGSAACCTNACANGALQCGSGGLQTCVQQSNGCYAWGQATACPNRTCASATACVDTNWAQWPVPNSATDVSAGAPNQETYEDNGDDTVTDKVTGLMWQKTATTTTYTWSGASNYCSTLSLGGYSGWRLPTFIELASIIDYTRAYTSAAINAIFNALISDNVWSSTTSAGVPTDVWGFSFYNGGTVMITSSTPANVRCVR